MATPREIAVAAERQDIRNRWLLSSPALVIIALAAIGPLSSMTR
jgi:spermidine/putrescine transport system permease protein